MIQGCYVAPHGCHGMHLRHWETYHRCRGPKTAYGSQFTKNADIWPQNTTELFKMLGYIPKMLPYIPRVVIYKLEALDWSGGLKKSFWAPFGVFLGLCFLQRHVLYVLTLLELYLMFFILHDVSCSPIRGFMPYRWGVPYAICSSGERESSSLLRDWLYGSSRMLYASL